MSHVVSVMVQPKTLSDGSVVYNVRLPPDQLGAVTEKDAYNLAEKVLAAIRDHTNERCKLIELCREAA